MVETAETPPLVAIVEDEPAVRRSLERLLKAANYAVVSYRSGTEFLDSVHVNPPDCVVMDLHMPGRTGLEVQQSLRSIGLLFPVVIITARDNADIRRQCLTQGAAGYLCKPLDGKDLLEIIEASLASTSDED